MAGSCRDPCGLRSLLPEVVSGTPSTGEGAGLWAGLWRPLVAARQMARTVTSTQVRGTDTFCCCQKLGALTEHLLCADSKLSIDVSSFPLTTAIWDRKLFSFVHIFFNYS